MYKMSRQMPVYFLRRYESQSLYMFHSQASTLTGFIMPKINIFNSQFSILLLITYFYTLYFTAQSGQEITIPLSKLPCGFICVPLVHSETDMRQHCLLHS
jgi:hypothetical protein